VSQQSGSGLCTSRYAGIGAGVLGSFASRQAFFFAKSSPMDITIKVFTKVDTGRGKLTRRQSMPRGINWSTVLRDHLLPIAIRDGYDPQTMTVEYKDADGDYIHIDSDAGWDECLQSADPSRPLQLFLRRAPGDTSPSSSEGSNSSVVSLEEVASELRHQQVASEAPAITAMCQLEATEEVPVRNISAEEEPLLEDRGEQILGGTNVNVLIELLEDVLLVGVDEGATQRHPRPHEASRSSDQMDEGLTTEDDGTKSTSSSAPSLRRRRPVCGDADTSSSSSLPKEKQTASPKSDYRYRKVPSESPTGEDGNTEPPPRKGGPFRYPKPDDHNGKGPKCDQKEGWLAWLQSLWQAFLSKAIRLSKDAEQRIRVLVKKFHAWWN